MRQTGRWHIQRSCVRRWYKLSGWTARPFFSKFTYDHGFELGPLVFVKW